MINLLFRADLDGKGVYGGLAKIRGAARGVGNGIGNSMKAGIASVISIGALVDQMVSSIENATKQAHVADAFGLSLDFIQKANYAAKMSGASIDDVATAVKNLQKAQVEALGGDKGKEDIFKRLGISIAELKTLNPEHLFSRVARAMNGLSGSSRETTDAISLMGRAASAEVLVMMRRNFAELGNNADRLGLVHLPEVIHKLSEMGDKMDRAKSKWASLMTGMTSMAIDAFNAIYDKMDAVGGVMVGFAAGTKNQTDMKGKPLTQADPITRWIEGGIVGAAQVIKIRRAKEREQMLKDLEELEMGQLPPPRPPGENIQNTSRRVGRSWGASLPDGDAFAKIGLFVGGTSGGFIQIQKDQLAELKAGVQETRALRAALERAL